jgi:hypothetical protein
MTSSLESLPNELWLLLMRYLSSFDLFRALVGLNYHIDCLLLSIRSPFLDTSPHIGIRFCEMYQLLEGKHDWSQHLLSSIEIIRLGGTHASDILCKHCHASSMEIFSSFSVNNNISFSNLFPSLRRLYVTEKAIKRVSILKLLLPISNSLRYVYLTFESFAEYPSYVATINNFIQHRLSFYSMTFDIVQEGRFICFYSPFKDESCEFFLYSTNGRAMQHIF